MGVLPLEFTDGAGAESLGLTGRELFDVEGLDENLEPGGLVTVTATADDGDTTTFQARIRLDSDVDVAYYRNGGILNTVLRKMARGEM
jgi:aconitate hydratase